MGREVRRVMTECPICESDFVENGFPACIACMKEYGDDPERLEAVAAHQARCRSVGSLRVTHTDWANTMIGLVRKVA